MATKSGKSEAQDDGQPDLIPWELRDNEKLHDDEFWGVKRRRLNDLDGYAVRLGFAKKGELLTVLVQRYDDGTPPQSVRRLSGRVLRDLRIETLANEGRDIIRERHTDSGSLIDGEYRFSVDVEIEDQPASKPKKSASEIEWAIYAWLHEDAFYNTEVGNPGLAAFLHMSVGTISNKNSEARRMDYLTNSDRGARRGSLRTQKSIAILKEAGFDVS